MCRILSVIILLKSRSRKEHSISAGQLKCFVLLYLRLNFLHPKKTDKILLIFCQQMQKSSALIVFCVYYDSNIYDNYDTTLSVQEESGLHKGLFTPSFNGSVNVNTCMDFIDLYLHHSHQASVVMPPLTLENAAAQSEQVLYISRLLNLEYKAKYYDNTALLQIIRNKNIQNIRN